MTLGRAEGAGVAERDSEGDADGLDGLDDGESVVLGVSGAGSGDVSGSEPPHPARNNEAERISVASRNICRA
jgi:hypothetical protein